MGQHTAIVDVGSSKIICLICSHDSKGSIVVHGAGIREYKGYRRGAFVDEQQFSDAIVDSMAMAEGEARLRIRDISIGVPAPFTKLVLHDGAVPVTGRGRRVTQETVDALINASLDFEQPEGYELMHSTPTEFKAGDVTTAELPIGLTADELSAAVSHVYVSARFKNLVSAALSRAGLDADLYVGVPLSEALFVIPPAERTNCAVLLDVGATHTDVSLIRQSALIACETIPVGGAHFASDIAYGLRIEQGVAENVKRRYVYSLDYQDSIDIIRTPGGGVMNVEHAAIQYIVEARSMELAELIRNAIAGMGVEIGPGLPVYLTGGGISLMRGSCEFLERQMGVSVKVHMPWMPRLSSPNYASAFSVMDFVMHSEDEQYTGRLLSAVSSRGILKKLRSLFSK